MHYFYGKKNYANKQKYDYIFSALGEHRFSSLIFQILLEVEAIAKRAVVPLLELEMLFPFNCLIYKISSLGSLFHLMYLVHPGFQVR